MSQHDFNIANQSFPNTRSDINNALVALATNSSGAAAPSTTNAFMNWADSGNDIMKLRNEANSDWISLFKTDGVQQYASGSTAALPAFSKADDVDTGLYFPSADNIAIATGGTGRLYIDSSGNVGLNNATPSATLDVAGDMVVDTNTLKVDSTNNRVGIGTSTPTAKLTLGRNDTIGEIGRIGFDVATYQRAYIAANRHTSSGQLTDMTFGTMGTERMRINSSGDLILAASVANATNAVTLSHLGFIHARRQTSLAAIFQRDNSGVIVQFRYSASNNNVGDISTNGSSTSYNTTSDYRLKENVKPIEDGLSRLMELKPSRFNFINNKDTVVDGFLAHEAQEIVPESVTGVKDGMKEVGNITDKDGKVIEEKVEKPENLKKDQKWEKTGEEADYQGIDQSKLVPLLVSAVQQLKKEIDKLKNKK